MRLDFGFWILNEGKDYNFGQIYIESSEDNRFHSMALAVANTCGAPMGLSAPLSPSNETSLERYSEDFTKKD
ncbi:hypothetical protein [Nitratifractor sp.]|uniref:hypothetical protein n=1 Tax=Nitratifractor sp. TaxID=2268144 RepID=UPI0025CBACEA|nr:hypothetical protein [Nitratifractor sp.]